MIKSHNCISQAIPNTQETQNELKLRVYQSFSSLISEAFDTYYTYSCEMLQFIWLHYFPQAAKASTAWRHWRCIRRGLKFTPGFQQLLTSKICLFKMYFECCSFSFSRSPHHEKSVLSTAPGVHILKLFSCKPPLMCLRNTLLCPTDLTLYSVQLIITEEITRPKLQQTYLTSKLSVFIY